MFVYADNAATTRLSETALAAMLPCLREQYGNPSSLHAAGQAAKRRPRPRTRDNGAPARVCAARAGVHLRRQ